MVIEVPAIFAVRTLFAVPTTPCTTEPSRMIFPRVGATLNELPAVLESAI
jgi:hypothetical protein